MKRPTRPATPPAVKPRRLWQGFYGSIHTWKVYRGRPVLVIALTPESIEAMRENITRAQINPDSVRLSEPEKWWKNYKANHPQHCEMTYGITDAILRAISPHLAPRNAQQPTTTAAGTRRGRKG